MARRDPSTVDMFTEYNPPALAIRFDQEAHVRAAGLSHLISRAVSETLSDHDRTLTAEMMTDYLGASVSVDILNKYASPSADHTISLERAVALVSITKDPRIFGELLHTLGFAVIDKRYLAAAEEAMVADTIETLTHKRKTLRKRWKGHS